MKLDGIDLAIIMMLILFKGIQASTAGPAPNYDMQKILATRGPREAALMSKFVSVVLMPVRYTSWWRALPCWVCSTMRGST